MVACHAPSASATSRFGDAPALRSGAGERLPAALVRHHGLRLAQAFEALAHARQLIVGLVERVVPGVAESGRRLAHCSTRVS